MLNKREPNAGPFILCAAVQPLKYSK